MRKLIILKHGGGELANQLWNYVSIYAYGLEIGAQVENPSFFEHHASFTLLPQENIITRMYSFFFRTPRRRSHPLNRVARFKYAFYAYTIVLTHKKCVYSSDNMENRVTLLPPTISSSLQLSTCETTYFTGWLFRNPQGLRIFRAELISLFKPIKRIESRVDQFMKPLRTQYKNVIGVHIRQGDYATFKKGIYLIPQARIRTILEEYITQNSLKRDETLFVITSDGLINLDVFDSLKVVVSRENFVTDLFILSKMDAIIGSESTFGAFASWYGDIPHIVFKNEPIDWLYYKDKKKFFENRYNNLIKYS